MFRTDGRKLVALAFATTTFAVGVGTVYLPFMADRDKLRGLFEEDETNGSIAARREAREEMRRLAEERKRDSNESSSAGSMWKKVSQRAAKD
mmetsp:Transcript_260/g.412  ORF Transcript_260/g.412 Transcript_260/m.412 type:complete len:92 (+) Transcript_260:121-396(+)